MKKILLFVFTIATFAAKSQIQYGGQIRAQANDLSLGFIKRVGDNFKVYDSAVLGKLNATIAVTQSGSWNITNISGTISLPTGASTLSEQQTQTTALQLIDNLPNTLGSTTSGQSGVLGLGAVTTSAPSYTTAQTNALSLQPDGSLRTAVTNTVTANATLSAETTKVIGVVRNADGSGNLLTSNSTTFTAKFGLDVNILGTLGTAFSTAGKMDIKGADGDVFIRQATASNLNATIVGTGTFAAQVASNTAPVNTMNSASANSGVNSAVALLFDDVSPTSITENSFGYQRMSANHNAYTTIRDAAGNERGANVDASNRLSVTIDNIASSLTLGTITTVSTVTNLSQLGGTAIAMNTGTRSAGTQRVTIATDDIVPASQSGTWTMQPGNTANTTAWLVTPTPGTTGGWSVFNATSGDGSTALTNTAQSVKGSQGTLGGWYVYNPNSSVTYLVIYNVASGSVTVGTTNPAMVVPIPATSGANVEWTNGIQFGTAISIAAATTAAGNGAPSSALEVNILYK